MAVDVRKGEKNGKTWELVEVTAFDAGLAPMLKTPLVFNLDKQDSDMAASLEGHTIEIAIVKLDTYNGKLDVKCRVSRKSWEAANKGQALKSVA